MRTRKLVAAVVLAALCAVPVLLYLSALPLSVRFTGAGSALTAIGAAAGIAAFCAFALNLVLGGRLRLVERAFGGLDRMYDVHRVVGRVVFILLAVHAVLIIAGRAVVSWTGAWGLFDPSNGWTVLIGVAAFVSFAIGIALTLYGKLEHETFVYVQRALGAIFLVGALHVFRTPGTKAISKTLTFYLLFMFLIGAAAWLRRSVLPDVLVKRHDYRVSRVSPLDRAVVEVTMSPMSGGIDFVPGQFVFVTFGSREMAKRFRPFSHSSQGAAEVITLRPGEVMSQFHPFSITSAKGESDLRVAVKAVGDYTSAMRALEGGAGARVEGPYGGFSYLRVKSQRQVWIAGGIGITPFLGMARSLSCSGFSVDLYFAVKRKEEAYFLQELLELSQQKPCLRIILFPEDEKGFVTAAEVERTSGDLTDTDVLICGPPVMIDALASQFLERGIPGGRVHYEKFRFGPS